MELFDRVHKSHSPPTYTITRPLSCRRSGQTRQTKKRQSSTASTMELENKSRGKDMWEAFCTKKQSNEASQAQ